MKLTEELTDFENYSEDLRTGGLMRELLSPTLPVHHFKEIDKLINETVKLKVGSFVILRDDLVSGREYDNCLYVTSMAYSFNKDKLIDEKIPYLKIKEYINTLLKSEDPENINHFVVYDQPPFMSYPYEMLHWEKSIILNYLISKLKFCIEEAMYILDRVYANYISTVNSNILSNKHYTQFYFDDPEQDDSSTSNEGKCINNTSREGRYVDLELKNTSVLRLQDMVLNQNTLTSKVTDDMLNTSTIKTIRSNEEHDIEKAVMMIILKGLNINYSDILKCVELVQEKWTLERGNNYYYIDDLLQVKNTVFFNNGHDTIRIKNKNYFKTYKEAETKAEEIKKLLNK